jgi:DNA-binding NtrC family response regulator
MKEAKEKKRILIVDDEKATVDVACHLLSEAGFETVGARNSKDAMSEMKKKIAHAILLDIYLGQENGLAFLIKFKEEYPHVPVLILTGIGYDNSAIKTALQNGASGYFSKETGLENIIPVLQRLISE